MRETSMQRWGVFSVIDHKNDVGVATELLLYDKIAVPVPMDRHGADWKRWDDAGWDPEKLMKLIERLGQAELVEQIVWDGECQDNWQSAFKDAKADIDRVSAEIQNGIDKRVAAAKTKMAGHSKAERAKAIKAAAWAETRNEIIRHLKGNVGLHHGPTEFYAAYQSKSDFDHHHPEEEAIEHGVERVNFLIQHRLAVPDEPRQMQLDRVIDIATNSTFKERRQDFYDWQIDLLTRRHKPEQILKDLDRLVNAFNAQALAHDRKCRSETVITVLAMSGAMLAALVGFCPDALPVPDAARYAALAGGMNTAGLAVWRKFLAGKEVDAPRRIAMPGAMFHQIEDDTRFQFLTRGPRVRA